MTALMVVQGYLVVCGAALTVAVVKYIIDGLESLLN